MVNKKIGLLIGDEQDWPAAFEGLARRFAQKIEYKNVTYKIDVERVRIHPFRLDAPTSYDLVIDRLAYWHYQPREWLKKVALLDRVYLLNNPFTFQSMEKHTAYCAMVKLGLNIPETWLIPPKMGPEAYQSKFETTAANYHDLFNLSEIAADIQYPLFMKPFDGGGWRGVSQIKNEEDLLRAYDESGQTLMHLQAGLDNYDVFVRSLAIGPQVISLNYDPSQPMHGRYKVDHNFLSAEKGEEAKIITKVINAFFRWDFNSCETILKDGVMWPIDFANACPDIAITSLHYYFPWAIKSLLAWSIFGIVTDRPMHVTMDIKSYFDIAESDRSYIEKLRAYEVLADAHFETERFEEFKITHLKHLDETMWEYARSKDFDHILVNTVRGMFPENEHEQYIAHFRGLIEHWIRSEAAQR
ncbi:MAG: RimK family alpha-L-glutamate ligase [Anaerolineae bacterium]